MGKFNQKIEEEEEEKMSQKGNIFSEKFVK